MRLPNAPPTVATFRSWRSSAAARSAVPTPVRRAPPVPVAERVGFEPTVPVRVHTLSKRAPSAARSSLRSPVTAAGRGALSGRGRLRQRFWRREWDSNPRNHLRGSTDFESARFDRSRISPFTIVAAQPRNGEGPHLTPSCLAREVAATISPLTDAPYRPHRRAAPTNSQQRVSAKLRQAEQCMPKRTRTSDL